MSKEKKTTVFSKAKLAKLILKLSIRLIPALLILEIGYVLGLMPDWDQFIYGPIQKSRVIQQYQYQQTINKGWPRLKWYPIPLSQIPDHLKRAVIVAEDGRFYHHKGFDQEAIKNAIEYNLSKGRLIYGASTISQQTIKNLLLSHSRDPLRKLHESLLTYAMERKVGKTRILEIYLNIVEFGRGIYGVDAASRVYFRKPVGEITTEQSIELAATLPAPTKHNPATRTKFFKSRRNKIKRHLGF